VVSNPEYVEALTTLLNKRVDMQTAFLHAIAHLLDSNIIDNDTHQQLITQNQGSNQVVTIDQLKQSIFEALGQVKRMSSMSYLMRLVRQPIGPTKHASLDILRSVARQSHAWGIRTLFECKEFKDYVTDVESETTKESREWKYGLIEAIAYSDNINLIDANVAMKIKAIAEKGPHYAPPSVRLATLEA
jgi:hypothetical protein